MIPILSAVLLVVLPILVFPFGSYSFETSKVLIAEIAIWIIVLYFFVRSNVTVTSRIFQNLFPYIVLIGLIIFHLLRAPHAEYIWGNPMRLQGVIFYMTVLLFSVVSSRIRFTIDARFVTGIVGLLFVSAYMVQSTETTRAVGLSGESNALAAAAIGLWPFCVRFARSFNKTELLYSTVSMLLTIAIVLVSGSRSGLMALTIQLLLYMIIQYKREFLKGILYFSFGLYVFMHAFVFMDTMSSIEQRADIWRVAFHAVRAHPIIGTGVGSIESSLQQASWDISSPVRFLFVDSAHNIFLDFWIQFGIFGVICLGFFIYLSFKTFYLHGEWMKFLQLIGILVVSSFNPLSVISLVLLWYLFGQGYAKR